MPEKDPEIVGLAEELRRSFDRYGASRGDDQGAAAAWHRMQACLKVLQRQGLTLGDLGERGIGRDAIWEEIAFGMARRPDDDEAYEDMTRDHATFAQIVATRAVGGALGEADSASVLIWKASTATTLEQFGEVLRGLRTFDRRTSDLDAESRDRSTVADATRVIESALTGDGVRRIAEAELPYANDDWSRSFLQKIATGRLSRKRLIEG